MYFHLPSFTDRLTVELDFNQGYRHSIPEWMQRDVLHNEAQSISTDGSKTMDGVGAGVFTDDLDIHLTFNLPNHGNVFQAEIIAIGQGADWLTVNNVLQSDKK